MNHDLIKELFGNQFNKKIVVDFPWTQKFLTEKPDGRMEVREIIENNVRVILFEEKINKTRFMSINPRYGVEYIASLSANVTDRPVIIDSVGKKKDDRTLVDLTLDEVEYFMTKFIKGVTGNEKEKTI